MSQFSWIDRPVPAELGAIAHGPRLLSESNGYRVGMRHIVAYRHVMDVALVVSGVGPQSSLLAAQFIVREVPGEPLAVTKRRRIGFTAWLLAPELSMSARGSNQNPHTVDGHYIREFSYVIDGRPGGTSLELEYSWPEIALERTQIRLDMVKPKRVV